MAALTATTMQGAGQRTMTPNTLTSSDTFPFTQGTGQLLIFYNSTGSTITPQIKGDGVSGNYIAPDMGTSYSLSSGLNTVAVTAGNWWIVNLDDCRQYLAPTNTITLGSGLTAFFLSN